MDEEGRSIYDPFLRGQGSAAVVAVDNRWSVLPNESLPKFLF